MTATALHAVPHHSRVHRALNREQHSLYNCLLSILDDTRFVNEIRALYPSLPVFVNLRCGLWYSSGKHETCYFKSTDGHSGNWSFSCVRLNLQVAEACCRHGGCLVIDATRRGKTFPVCSRIWSPDEASLPYSFKLGTVFFYASPLRSQRHTFTDNLHSLNI